MNKCPGCIREDGHNGPCVNKWFYICSAVV